MSTFSSSFAVHFAMLNKWSLELGHRRPAFRMWEDVMIPLTSATLHKIHIMYWSCRSLPEYKPNHSLWRTAFIQAEGKCSLNTLISVFPYSPRRGKNHKAWCNYQPRMLFCSCNTKYEWVKFLFPRNYQTLHLWLSPLAATLVCLRSSLTFPWEWEEQSGAPGAGEDRRLVSWPQFRGLALLNHFPNPVRLLSQVLGAVSPLLGKAKDSPSDTSDSFQQRGIYSQPLPLLRMITKKRTASLFKLFWTKSEWAKEKNSFFSSIQSSSFRHCVKCSNDIQFTVTNVYVLFRLLGNKNKITNLPFILFHSLGELDLASFGIFTYG